MSKKLLIIITFIAIILSSFIFIYVGVKVNEDNIDVTQYSVTSEKIPIGFDNYKIVQLSDFHGKGYKETTEIIIDEIKDIDPDMIVMTGDMISWDVEEIDNIKKLINSLVDVYPIYYINGNHEQLAEIIKKDEYNMFLKEIIEKGVKVIKDTYVEVYNDEQSIRLYEINIPLESSTGLYIKKNKLDDNYINDKLFDVDYEKFNILLAHNPLFIEEYSKWGADLVLSGHMHGGIIRIPFIEVGVMSPEKKFFPKYDGGEFIIGNTTMIVNRGIGSSSFSLRVFNNPEISVIKLKCKL